MGLREFVISGSKLSRLQTTVAAGTGSVDLGYSYILLSLSATAACRVRLYSDSSSISVDVARPTSSFIIDPSVGLTLDAELTAGTSSILFAPPIIGTTFTSSLTWYNITTLGTNVTLNYYPIELNNTSSRTTLRISESAVVTGSARAGTITVPNGYIILNGSATTESRLRLYSNTDTIVSPELDRSFGDAPAEGSRLVADMMFDTGSFNFKLVPLLQAFVLSPSYLEGDNQMGYLINNISATSTINTTASFTIYPIET